MFQKPSIFKAADYEARSLSLFVNEQDSPKTAYQLDCVIVRNENVWICEHWDITEWHNETVSIETEDAILGLFFDTIDNNLIWRGEPTLAPTKVLPSTSDSE